MGIFGGGAGEKKACRLSDFSGGQEPDVFVKALPGLVRNLVNLAQASAIKFYRRVHSHETGTFLGVRNEFIFLFSSIVQNRISSLFPPGAAEKIRQAFREDLEEAVSDLQKGLSTEAFSDLHGQRVRSYGMFALSVSGRRVSLKDSRLPVLFAGFIGSHLESSSDLKIAHFSEQVIRDALNDL